jgi:hypothetical protein
MLASRFVLMMSFMFALKFLKACFASYMHARRTGVST